MMIASYNKFWMNDVNKDVHHFIAIVYYYEIYRSK